MGDAVDLLATEIPGVEAKGCLQCGVWEIQLTDLDPVSSGPILEEALIPAALEIMAEAESRGVAVHLPEDHVVVKDVRAGAASRIAGPGEIELDEKAVDIGPKTQSAYSTIVRSARTVLWNGPMGVFELPDFAAGTSSVARAVASCGGLSVVGGGDSVAAIRTEGLERSFGHLSTGGGAMLEFLSGKSLPGIEALTSR